MPQNKNNPEPPTMTWRKAMPILVVAIIFDLVRCFFEWFVVLGPALGAALGAVVCTAGVNSAIGTTIAATTGKVVATGCTLFSTGAAGVAGFFLSETTETFGAIMSDIVGFAGFLTLGLWILMRNKRLFVINPSGSLEFVANFGICEIPFVGTIPAFSIMLYFMYKKQIKVEKAALKKWEQEQENNRLQERNQRIAELMQAKQAQLAEAEI
jgi:hypothetical protein